MFALLLLQNEIPASGDDTKDVEPKEADTNDLVSHHIVNGLYKTGDFHNNMVLSTVNNESTIRINVYHYPEKMITANCAPITMPNNFASNAVIHLVGRVIPKPTSTILSLIENDPRFTIFMSRKCSRLSFTKQLLALNNLLMFLLISLCSRQTI